MNNNYYILFEYFSKLSNFKCNNISVSESETSNKSKNKFDLIVNPQIIKDDRWYNFDISLKVPKNQNNYQKHQVLTEELEYLKANIVLFNGYYISFTYDFVDYQGVDDNNNFTYNINYNIKIKKEVNNE